MDRFTRIDNTAPVVDVAENEKPPVEYSTMDLSDKLIGQALPYAIIPIDVIDCLPNTKVWLNYDVEVTFRNPTVRKMLNGWRVYLHAYYNKKSDLWEGWNNFITKGRSGNMNLKIPHIKTRLRGMNEEQGIPSNTFTPFTPMSLYDYLGYAPEAYSELNTETGLKTVDINASETKKTNLANYENIEISALKAVMYQKIWRDKYSPQNLIQDNKNIFPDNEDHTILSYEANEVEIIKYEDEDNLANYCNTDIEDAVIGANNKQWRIDLLRFRQFKGDRFTTSSPFEEMLRGNAPQLEIEIDTENLTVTIPELRLSAYDEITETWSDTVTGHYTKGDNNAVLKPTAMSQGTTEFMIPEKQGIVGTNNVSKFAYEGGTTVRLNDGSIKSNVTLSQLRSLEVFTIFAERMARTNGSYNEMIYAQFGHNPKSNNREAIYIGGSFQDILQNSIFQTSESSEESMLGRQVSTGISASYNKLGEFTAEDHGYIMVLMSIVPDTVYINGIDRKDTALTMEEQYFPLFNNLSAEAILNRELFVSGDTATDNDAWGWAERFSEFKSRENKVVGFSQLRNDQDEYDSALVMARRFEQTPNLNARFVTGIPSNVDLSSFSSNDEPPFDFVIRRDVTVNYPMPYKTIPQGLGTRA